MTICKKCGGEVRRFAITDGLEWLGHVENPAARHHYIVPREVEDAAAASPAQEKPAQALVPRRGGQGRPRGAAVRPSA